MRLTTLLREASAMTWASKIPSLFIMVVTAAMCVAPLVTVGRTAATGSALQQRMEQAGARRLVVIDSRRQGFVNDRTRGLVRDLSTTQTATAFAAPLDVVNGVIGRGGTRVPLWPVLGPMQTSATLVQGRWPGEGEVVVSTTAMASLGLQHPAEYLASSDGLRQWAIVGSFTPAPGFEDLAAGGLTPSGGNDVGRELRVTLTSIAAAGATTTSVLSILDLVAVVVLADVLVRRRDLGRRRTLGVTRGDLTALVTAALTALTPAAYAAHRDPVACCAPAERPRPRAKTRPQLAHRVVPSGSQSR